MFETFKFEDLETNLTEVTNKVTKYILKTNQNRKLGAIYSITTIIHKI